MKNYKKLMKKETVKMVIKMIIPVAITVALFPLVYLYWSDYTMLDAAYLGFWFALLVFMCIAAEVITYEYASKKFKSNCRRIRRYYKIKRKNVVTKKAA